MKEWVTLKRCSDADFMIPLEGRLAGADDFGVVQDATTLDRARGLGNRRAPTLVPRFLAGKEGRGGIVVRPTPRPPGGMVDAADLKSDVREGLPVRVRRRAGGGN